MAPIPCTRAGRAFPWFALIVLLAATATPGLAAAAPAASANNHYFHWTPFLAPFHSVVLHLPIGFVMIAFALELYAWRRPGPELQRAISLVLVLCVASAAVTIALGLLRGGGGGYDERTLNLHKWYGISVGALTLAAWGAHKLALQRNGLGWLLHSYRALLVADLIVLVIAGHQGGNLTHGSSYLVKNAPGFVRELLDEEPMEEEATAAPGQSHPYLDKVKPIFDAKCASCHGGEKQKGGYRLDEPATALAGGDSGEQAITPGDPLKSNLVRLILLPNEDDDAMPPSGKEPLNAEESMAIIHWIQAGASFPQAVAARPAEPPAMATVEVAAAPPAPQPEPPRADAPSPARTAKVSLTVSIPAPVDFARDIKPVFEAHCLHCHGALKQKALLRLDTRAAALAGGRRWGPAIIPGRADKSPVYERISIPSEEDTAEEVMPPPHHDLRLTAREVAMIHRWIDDGAKWPAGLTLHEQPLVRQ